MRLRQALPLWSKYLEKEISSPRNLSRFGTRQFTQYSNYYPPDSNTMSTTPSCKVVLANTIAKALLAEVQADLARANIKPLLVGFLANDDPHAEKYAEWSALTCRDKSVILRIYILLLTW